MDLGQFWKEMSRDERRCFAREIGCSTGVITTAYIYPKDGEKKCPSNRRLAKMVMASNGKLTVGGLLKFFKERAVTLELSKLQK